MVEKFVPNLEFLRTLNSTQLREAGIYLTSQGLKPIIDQVALTGFRPKDVEALLPFATTAAVGLELWGGGEIPVDYEQAQYMGLAYLAKFIPQEEPCLPL
jgi:hypothetical protein